MLFRSVIEVTLIIGTLVAAAIQVIIADVARATSVMAVFLIAASRIAPALLRIQQGLLAIRANYGTAFEFINSFTIVNTLIQKKESRKPKFSSPNGGGSSLPLDLIIPKKADKYFEPNIKIENVTYNFPNSNKPIFKDLSLAIKSGEKVAIVGASGSGKSTLVDLMLGLREPYSEIGRAHV